MSIALYGLVAPLGVLLVFGFLIFIHELGHYAAGRYFGVPVEDFSLGFGPKLLAFRDRHGTTWAFRLLPLGGFVKFAGDANAASQPSEQKGSMDERVDALASLAIWKRSIVVAAGPAANIALAFVLLTFNFMIFGVSTTAPLIGAVEDLSPAQEAGFLPGDTVLSVNGRATPNIYSLTTSLEARLGQDTQVVVQRADGREEVINLTPQAGLGKQASLQASGLAPAFEFRVKQVLPASPAALMGLETGDIISTYNDIFITSPSALGAALLPHAEAGEAVRFRVTRNGQELDLRGVPEAQTVQTRSGTEYTYGRLGFYHEIVGSVRRLGPSAASRASVEEMHANALLIFKLPAQFIARQRSMNDLGGPVKIAEVVGGITLNAPYLLVFIAALLSLQLGILNLLPIPVLDGGHLVLYGAEAIWRRPLPPALVEWLFRFGFIVLISFMVMVTFNDLRTRLFGF